MSTIDQHAVAGSGALGGGVQRLDHREFADHGDVGDAHGLVGERGRGRADQPDRRRDAGFAQPRGVLESRLAERRGAAGEHRACDLGASRRSPW